MAEGEVWSATPFSAGKRSRIAIGVVGIIVFLLPGIGLSLLSVSSCSAYSASPPYNCTSSSTTYPFVAVGVILALIGAAMIAVMVYSLIKPKPKLRYVLTNKRAIVYSTVKDNQSVMQQCDLLRATMSVMNRHTISQSKSRSAGVAGGVVGIGLAAAGVGSSTAIGQSNQVGDVVFMVGGMAQVRFVAVSDPDGVLSTAQSIIASTRAA